LVAGNVAFTTMFWVAPPAVGTRVAVPGLTIVPDVNVVPLIWNVVDKFEYCVMVRPFELFGNNAEPPGNVTVNV